MPGSPERACAASSLDRIGAASPTLKKTQPEPDAALVTPTGLIPVETLPRRYPKRITPREAMERAEMMVRRNLPIYLSKLHELALGVTLAEVDGRSGKTKVYRTPPDKDVLKYLTDRGLGKVPDRFEVSGSGGGPLEVVAWAEPVIEGEVVKEKG